MVDDMPSLLSLQEELTCSICLSPFESPVTLPCGHNFCQTCLDESWRDMSYVCPQCRTRFSDKPVLKKNTVLNAVVETFKMKSGEPVAELKLKKAAPQVVVMCDTCMEASASKTCLTCMASFCLDHLRPHQNNPIFKSHQLTDPMLDMHEHMCPEHSKSMEFYCEDHGRCICSSCFHVHKSCSFTGLDEQRQKKEANFRSMLTVVDGKVEKNESVIYQMKEQLSRLNESASNRKSALQAEYQQLRDLIDKDELAALSAVDKAMQGGQDKLASLMKKFSQNVEKLSKAKTEINDLLLQSASLSFLQASVDLPAVVNFEPYCPQINLDSKDVISYHTSAVALKDLINTILLKPVEARISFIKPGNRMPPFLQVFPGEAGSAPYQHSSDPSHLKGPPGPKNKPKGGKKKPNDNSRKQPNQRQGPGSAFSKSTDNLTSLLDFFSPQKGATADPGNVARDISTAIVRSNLLKYGTNLTFDPRTAHKRIILSDNFSKATVSEEPASYPDCPARFSVCSQVLCNKGFSQGCHYWEVKMSSNNFCGLGFAYDSINRKGPASRLGRNAQSWCLEWFNGKLSAWHASSETSIANPNPSRVGILLDCDRGTATFYTVADRAYPFHTFVFPLSEAVFPAFWIFSSGSSASLCKLQA